MGGWSIWLTVSAWLVFIPVDMLVDATDFTTHYLQDEVDVVTGEAIRLKLRKRIMESLIQVVNCDEYDRVTVVAHSYGVLMGIELLVTVGDRLPKPIRLITLGGPMKFLSLRSPWIDQIIRDCLDSQAVSGWTDYYSDKDWLCTHTPVKGSIPDKFEHKKTIREIPLWYILSGKSHSSYFYEKDVIEQLLNDSHPK